MLKDVGNIHNKETREALEEAMSGKGLEGIVDVDTFGFYTTRLYQKNKKDPKQIERPNVIKLIRIGSHSDLF